MLYRFFKLQEEQSSKGDWVSTVLEDLRELRIEKSKDEMKQMSQYQFSNLLKLSGKENALKYLIGKQKTKGSEIKYSNLKMSEYLVPINEILKQNRNRKCLE